MSGRELILVVIALIGFVLAYGNRYEASGYMESVFVCKHGNVLLVLDRWTGRVSCEVIDGTAPPRAAAQVQAQEGVEPLKIQTALGLLVAAVDARRSARLTVT